MVPKPRCRAGAPTELVRKPPLHPFWRGSGAPQYTAARSPQSNRRPDYLLWDVQFERLPDSLVDIFLLPRHNCSYRARSIMSFLHSGCVRRLFSNVSPLGVPRTSLSWVRLFSEFRYTTGGCWSPDRSSSGPIVSTAASSLGTSWYLAKASISSGFASKSVTFNFS
jgi:hypothetical protein